MVCFTTAIKTNKDDKIHKQREKKKVQKVSDYKIIIGEHLTKQMFSDEQSEKKKDISNLRITKPYLHIYFRDHTCSKNFLMSEYI